VCGAGYDDVIEIRFHKYTLVSTKVFYILHMLRMISSVNTIKYANGVSSNMTGSHTDLFISWLSISIFCDIILTFPADAINFEGTHIVLSSVTAPVLPLAPCVNVCLCVK
jgi:hypothetical protein